MSSNYEHNRINRQVTFNVHLIYTVCIPSFIIPLKQQVFPSSVPVNIFQELVISHHAFDSCQLVKADLMQQLQRTPQIPSAILRPSHLPHMIQKNFLNNQNIDKRDWKI